MLANDAIRASRSRIGILFPLLAAACSTGGQKLTQTGFLNDYSKLERVDGHKNHVVWTSPDYRPAAYHSVIIAPVEWNAPRRDDAVEKKLTGELRRSLADGLIPAYRLVDGGSNTSATLRVRSAITGVRKTRWYLNAPAQAATFALGGIGIFAPLQGGASEEIQVEDARTGRVLVRIETYRNGQPWNLKGSYIAYDHARLAFEDAARLLSRTIMQPSETRRP